MHESSGCGMLLLSTVYLSIIECVTKNTLTRALAHTMTNIPNWFEFLWPMKEFLQAIIQGAYQLCLIWFDIIFIAFVSKALLGKKYSVIAIRAIPTNSAIRSMNFEKICHTKWIVITVISFCHLKKRRHFYQFAYFFAHGNVHGTANRLVACDKSWNKTRTAKFISFEFLCFIRVINIVCELAT